MTKYFNLFNSNPDVSQIYKIDFKLESPNSKSELYQEIGSNVNTFKISHDDDHDVLQLITSKKASDYVSGKFTVNLSNSCVFELKNDTKGSIGRILVGTLNLFWYYNDYGNFGLPDGLYLTNNSSTLTADNQILTRSDLSSYVTNSQISNYDNTGFLSYDDNIKFNWGSGLCYDNINKLSIDWDNRQLHYADDTMTTIPVLDWGNATLSDFNNKISLNWNSKQLWTSGKIFLDWDNGYFYDKNSNVVINLKLGLIGISSHPYIDYINGFLSDGNDKTVDYANSQLGYGTQSNFTPTVDWFSKELYDSNGNVTLNWDTGIVCFTGIQSIDCRNRILKNNTGHPTVNWGENKLVVDMEERVDWFNCAIYNSNMQDDPVIDWSSYILGEESQGVSIDWGMRRLCRGADTVFDWEEGILYNKAGKAVITIDDYPFGADLNSGIWIDDNGAIYIHAYSGSQDISIMSAQLHMYLEQNDNINYENARFSLRMNSLSQLDFYGGAIINTVNNADIKFNTVDGRVLINDKQVATVDMLPGGTAGGTDSAVLLNTNNQVGPNFSLTSSGTNQDILISASQYATFTSLGKTLIETSQGGTEILGNANVLIQSIEGGMQLKGVGELNLQFNDQIYITAPDMKINSHSVITDNVYASIGQAGLVSTGTQTFTGNKTFEGQINVDPGKLCFDNLALQNGRDANFYSLMPMLSLGELSDKNKYTDVTTDSYTNLPGTYNIWSNDSSVFANLPTSPYKDFYVDYSSDYADARSGMLTTFMSLLPNSNEYPDKGAYQLYATTNIGDDISLYPAGDLFYRTTDYNGSEGWGEWKSISAGRARVYAVSPNTSQLENIGGSGRIETYQIGYLENIDIADTSNGFGVRIDPAFSYTTIKINDQQGHPYYVPINIGQRVYVNFISGYDDQTITDFIELNANIYSDNGEDFNISITVTCNNLSSLIFSLNFDYPIIIKTFTDIPYGV